MAVARGILKGILKGGKGRADSSNVLNLPRDATPPTYLPPSLKHVNFLALFSFFFFFSIRSAEA